MMKMRLFLTLGLILLLLVACAPDVVLLTRAPEPTETEIPTPKPIPTSPSPTPAPPTEIPLNAATLSGIRVTLWHGLDGTTGATLRKLAAEFSQKNEWGIQVNVVSQKNLPLLLESLGTVMRTPQQPDFVLALPENAQGWEAQGLVTDLAPYVRHAKLGLTAEEIKDIPPAFWEQDQIKGSPSTGSVTKQLSAPAMRSGRFLFYNVTFAKSLGFTAPPLSTDDFRKQACAANASWKTDADLTNDGFGGLVIENAMTDLLFETLPGGNDTALQVISALLKKRLTQETVEVWDDYGHPKSDTAPLPSQEFARLRDMGLEVMGVNLKRVIFKPAVEDKLISQWSAQWLKNAQREREQVESNYRKAEAVAREDALKDFATNASHEISHSPLDNDAKKIHALEMLVHSTFLGVRRSAVLLKRANAEQRDLAEIFRWLRKKRGENSNDIN